MVPQKTERRRSGKEREAGRKRPPEKIRKEGYVTEGSGIWGNGSPLQITVREGLLSLYVLSGENFRHWAFRPLVEAPAILPKYFYRERLALYGSPGSSYEG